MSWYAVWLIGNSNHKDYGKVGGFITEAAYEGDEEGSPMHRETLKEMEDELRDHPLLKPGWIDFIEIIC